MESKYLKYKNKYLNLKNRNILRGGYSSIGGNIDLLKEEIKKMEEEANTVLPTKLGDKWKLHDINNDEYNFKVAQHKFENNSDRNLVFMGGFSVNSFCESMEIITKKLDKLGLVFGSVYGICLAPFKPMQKNVCMNYDKYDETRLNDRYNENKNEVYVYEGEDKLNMDIAKIVNNIIMNKLKLAHVSLLGKCAGGGVAIYTASLGNYDALYLAVPGNPMSVLPLLSMDSSILDNMKFIFGWNEDGEFKFKWGESAKEILEYNKLMKHIENYESYLFKIGGHEISLELLDKIVQQLQINELDTEEIDTDTVTDSVSNIETTTE
jgi:hypothetical protein